MRRLFFRMLILCFVFLIFSCNSGRIKKKIKPIRVFCASSLNDVITDLTMAFSLTNDVEFLINSASSGTLARQIEHGANADVFISANKQWVEYLNDKKLTISYSNIKLAGNSLVIIVPVNSSIDTIDLNKGVFFPDIFKGRISIGDPEFVPAGKYTKQALGKMSYYESLKNRLLPAKDVRSALKVVEMSEAEAGIVFFTDALKSNKVRSVSKIPNDYHQPIEYWAIRINNSDNIMSSDFCDFLLSDIAKVIWTKHGFTP